MKRRDLLAGILAAPAAAEVEQQEAASLYIPKAQRVDDLGLLHDFMDEFAFVDLVTAEPALRITHIPVLLNRTGGAYGTIFGHISRNNPQTQAIESGKSAVIVFRGPHAYISPTWYNKAESVPTWNFAVVHATGTLKPITDKTAVHDLLAQLIKKFEGRYGGTTYDFANLPDSYIYGMIGGIIGFELRVESLEGKFKLGQERNDADKAGILQHLESAAHERSMHDFTASFYARLKKAGKGPA